MQTTGAGLRDAGSSCSCVVVQGIALPRPAAAGRGQIRLLGSRDPIEGAGSSSSSSSSNLLLGAGRSRERLRGPDAGGRKRPPLLGSALAQRPPGRSFLRALLPLLSLFDYGHWGPERTTTVAARADFTTSARTYLAV